MNSPKAPDDSRDWDSIDVFLFTNGQEYSPPRKYHLKTEELKWWDATLNFLARSQFGSMHSNIELYTLDGKKINTPLDLANDAAYVAVKPPDVFVQSGYEKYLLKATRSREKRQEKLNNTEISKAGFANIEINKEPIKVSLNKTNDISINNGKEMENGLRIDKEIEYSTKVENNIINPESQQMKVTNNSLRSEKPELLQRKKLESNTRNTILKKIYPNSKGKEDEHNLNKKRITSFPKNLVKSRNNSKISSNTLKTNLEAKVQTKEEPHNKTVKNITEINEKSEQLGYPVVENLPKPNKDLTMLSDVYKNGESDRQSVLVDADRKTAILSNDKSIVPQAVEKNDEFGEGPNFFFKTDMPLSQQSASNVCNIQTPYNVNQPATLNINLSIDLKGYTIFKSEEIQHANKCNTYVTQMKPEKSSQINIDVNLNRENFEYDVLPQEESIESSIAKTRDEKFAESNNKVIVHCKCNLIKSDNEIPYNFKENDHYLIVIPTEKINKLMSRVDVETRRGSDKEIQELLRSCIRIPVSSNSQILSDKKPESGAKHKVSMSQDAPKELNSDCIAQLKKSQEDMIPALTNYTNNNKIDNFTQTEWYNIVLQAKCHEDGRYTYHLPPLHLLKQYNLL